jgi:hypothetical protein
MCKHLSNKHTFLCVNTSASLPRGRKDNHSRNTRIYITKRRMHGLLLHVHDTSHVNNAGKNDCYIRLSRKIESKTHQQLLKTINDFVWLNATLFMRSDSKILLNCPLNRGQSSYKTFFFHKLRYSMYSMLFVTSMAMWTEYNMIKFVTEGNSVT